MKPRAKILPFSEEVPYIPTIEWSAGISNLISRPPEQLDSVIGLACPFFASKKSWRRYEFLSTLAMTALSLV